MQDSLTISTDAAIEGEIQPHAPYPTDTAHHYQIRHPYQVLRMLPKDATPAQQDSAIQAVFQPGEIHYSERPDTLHLPGHPIGKSILDVSLPQYYNETYFKNDSLYHPEIEAARFGIAGDPVPYRQSNDDGITIMLLMFIIGTILALSRLRRFIYVQIKEFFAPKRENELRQNETSIEVIVQRAMAFMGCIVLGLLFFNYTQQYISDTFILPSEYMTMGIFCAEALGYLLVKNLMARWVNSIFFTDSDLPKWNESKMLLQAWVGVMLLPILLLNIYFGLSLKIVLVYLSIIYILYEFLLFYKSINIFLIKILANVQIFLYLCTLEFLPIATLWVSLTLTAENLTISY